MEIEGNNKSSKMVNISSSKNGIMRALVVDDDIIIRTIHGRILQKLGIEYEQVKNGKEAIDHIHSSGNFFDLILMDLDMPILNGIQATKQLRAMGIDSKIAGISTHSKEEQATEEFIKAGLDDYIQKPLNTAKLVSILNKNPNFN